MAKISDKQHKKMIALYAECQNYRAVARAFGVSETTARRHITGDARTAEMVARKKEQNTIAILEHMNKQKNQVCGLLDRLINAMDDPAKMDTSTLPQLATTLGILVDKYTADEAHSHGIDAENNIFEAINESTREEINTDEIPEIEHQAKPGHDLVE